MKPRFTSLTPEQKEIWRWKHRVYDTIRRCRSPIFRHPRERQKLRNITMRVFDGKYLVLMCDISKPPIKLSSRGCALLLGYLGQNVYLLDTPGYENVFINMSVCRDIRMERSLDALLEAGEIDAALADDIKKCKSPRELEQTLDRRGPPPGAPLVHRASDR